MDPVDEIERAQSAELADEDGNAVTLELAPRLPAGEIAGLEAELGLPLPRELRTLLEHTAGIDGTALETIDFSGRSLSFATDEFFPAGLPIAGDGYGNFWVLDVTPDAPDVAPVFYACHDPAVIVYQSPGLGHFLHETFAMSTPPHESLVDDVQERAAFEVWHENARELEHAVALAADDELRAFAKKLDDRFALVDLREPEIGAGFSWGRHGPRTDVRRHGYARIYALAPPEKQPGFLGRLLGR